MITLSASVCIEASADRVWARLAALEDIVLWSEPILHARCEGPLSQGVGHRTIKERWVAWEEGRSFTYEGVGVPLMKRAVNRWSVLPQGEKTLLTSEAELEIKGGLVGRLAEPFLDPLLRRMAPTALVAFTYLVEHGQPYAGKASTLPKASALC